MYKNHLAIKNNTPQTLSQNIIYEIKNLVKEEKKGLSLDLSNMRIGDDYIPFLIENVLKNPAIESLNLSFNDLTNEGVKLLAAHSQVKEIHLDYNHIGISGLQALLENQYLSSLSMTNNCLGNGKKVIFAENGRLKVLNVAENNVSSRLLKQLLPKLTNLTSLNIAQNPLTAEGLNLITNHSTLRKACLMGIKISNLALERFSQNRKLKISQ